MPAWLTPVPACERSRPNPVDRTTWPPVPHEPRVKVTFTAVRHALWVVASDWGLLRWGVVPRLCLRLSPSATTRVKSAQCRWKGSTSTRQSLRSMTPEVYRILPRKATRASSRSSSGPAMWSTLLRIVATDPVRGSWPPPQRALYSAPGLASTPGFSTSSASARTDSRGPDIFESPADEDILEET